MSFRDLQDIANAALFAGSGFGESITYTPEGDTPFAVQGIYRRRDLEGGTVEHQVDVLAATVTGGASAGASVTVRGTTYAVIDVLGPDDADVVQLLLAPDVLLEHLLNRTVEIYREAPSQNESGGYTPALAIVALTQCGVRPAGAGEVERALQAGAEISHVLLFRAGENVRRGDVAQIGDVRYRVISVREPQKLGHHFEADAVSDQP